MDWVFEHFQIVALVALAFASWLKSRMDAKMAEQAERKPREETGQEDVFGPDEAWRGILEKLAPPAPPPVPGAQYEPGQEDQAVLKRQMEMQERLRQAREARSVTTGGAAATRSRVAERKTSKAGPPVTSSLHEALRDRRQVRRAVVLREILGPPLGLR
jgi:type IV secretory pathway VirB10-like protein